MEGQELSANATGWTAAMQKNLAIVVIIVLAGAVGFLYRVIERKDEQLQKKEEQIVKCKEEATVITERLLTQINEVRSQSQLNGSKGDNIFERQALVLDNLEDLKREVKRLKLRR